MTHAELVASLFGAQPQIFIIYNHNNTSVSVWNHVQIRSLKTLVRMQVMNECQLSLLSPSTMRMQVEQLFICINPYDNQIFPWYLSYRWAHSQGDNSRHLRWNVWMPENMLELVAVGRKTIFETPHKNSAKIFLAQLVHIHGQHAVQLHLITEQVHYHPLFAQPRLPVYIWVWTHVFFSSNRYCCNLDGQFQL